MANINVPKVIMNTMDTGLRQLRLAPFILINAVWVLRPLNGVIDKGDLDGRIDLGQSSLKIA